MLLGVILSEFFLGASLAGWLEGGEAPNIRLPIDPIPA